MFHLSRFRFQERKGFTLVEVIVATFIIAVGLMGVFALLQFSTSATLDVDFQLTAAYLAQEGVEAVRQIRDSNFLDIHRCTPAGTCGIWTKNGLDNTSCSGGCEIECIVGGTYPLCDSNGSDVDIRLAGFGNNFLSIENGYYTQSAAGQPTPFKRKITINEVDLDIDGETDRLDVHVQVTWETARDSGSVAVETQLFNWLPLTI